MPVRREAARHAGAVLVAVPLQVAVRKNSVALARSHVQHILEALLVLVVPMLLDLVDDCLDAVAERWHLEAAVDLHEVVDAQRRLGRVAEGEIRRLPSKPAVDLSLRRGRLLQDVEQLVPHEHPRAVLPHRAQIAPGQDGVEAREEHLQVEHDECTQHKEQVRVEQVAIEDDGGEPRVAKVAAEHDAEEQRREDAEKDVHVQVGERRDLGEAKLAWVARMDEHLVVHKRRHREPHAKCRVHLVRHGEIGPGGFARRNGRDVLRERLVHRAHGRAGRVARERRGTAAVLVAPRCVGHNLARIAPWLRKTQHRGRERRRGQRGDANVADAEHGDHKEGRKQRLLDAVEVRQRLGADRFEDARTHLGDVKWRDQESGGEEHVAVHLRTREE
eukprot:4211116-Prymnesium_polylepis.1